MQFKMSETPTQNRKIISKLYEQFSNPARFLYIQFYIKIKTAEKCRNYLGQKGCQKSRGQMFYAKDAVGRFLVPFPSNLTVPRTANWHPFAAGYLLT